MQIKGREKIAQVKEAIIPSFDQLAARAKAAGRVSTEQLSQWFNAALGSDFKTPIDRWMGHAFSSKASVYDKAMDATYNETQVGGGDHRLFDGGHDLVGAWHAVSNANPDDTFSQTVGHYFVALWKDVVTPNGLPFVTFNHDSFQETSGTLHDVLGISTGWLKDWVSYTATEVIGASVGVMAVLLNWKAEDVRRFSNLVGSYGLSAAFGHNPILLLLAVVCLGRAFHEARMKQQYGFLAKDALKGGFGTGVFLAVTSTCAPHIFVGLMFGVCAGVMAHKGFDRGSAALSRVNWSEIASFIYRFLKANLKRTGTDLPLIGFFPALPAPSL